jgi:2-methylcitrate dehydratase PrpD
MVVSGPCSTHPPVTGSDVAAIAAAMAALCTWAVETTFDDIPRGVRERAGLVLIDDLAAIVAARTDPECADLVAAMLASGGTAEASVFDGSGRRTDLFTAAMANAAAGTWCELDEGYRHTFCHAGIYIVPALLARAEATGRPTGDVLRALVLAYEIVTRIARAFPGTTRELHPHGCFAAVGAAAASVLLAGTAAQALHRAIDTACCMINPTPFDQAYGGAMARNLFAAVGTGNGMRAAEWSALGIHALDTAPAGTYARGLGAGVNPAALRDGLGEDWAILGNFQRLYACCQFGHSTIEATLELRDTLGAARSVDDIRRIVVEIHPLGMHLDSVTPTTTLGARFSMPHITAAVTRLGHAGVDAFSLAAIADPAIAALRGRIELVPWTPAPVPPRDRPARVTWHLSDGTRLTAACESARGEPGREFTRDEILAKLDEHAGDDFPGLSTAARAICDLDATALARSWQQVAYASTAHASAGDGDPAVRDA